MWSKVCCVGLFEGGPIGLAVGRGEGAEEPAVEAACECYDRVFARAMVLAGDHLFAAGTPDVVDPDDPPAAFEGRAGAAPGRPERRAGREGARVADSEAGEGCLGASPPTAAQPSISPGSGRRIL